MNNSRFYDWYQPTRSRYPSTYPVEMFNPKSTTTYTNPSPPKKIVTVPVHFVRSESTRLESTLKIQKVFRGFMARRKVKQISDLKRQVDDVEFRISNSVEILRIDAKERLRLNESLMSLLLKLDSIHGTVPGVRDFRKAVIKKAIALQERIDDIASATEDQTLEMKHSIEEEIVKDELIEEETVKDDSIEEETVKDDSIEEETVKDDSIGGICNCDVVEEVERISAGISLESSVPFVEPIQSSPTAEEEEGRPEETSIRDGEEGDTGKSNKEEEEEEVEMKKLGRRMVMAKLLESNEIQMRMIRSLTERIEQLEKALLCEKLKKNQKNMKKKKKMRHSIVGSCGDRWELRNYY